MLFLILMTIHLSAVFLLPPLTGPVESVGRPDIVKARLQLVIALSMSSSCQSKLIKILE